MARRSASLRLGLVLTGGFAGLALLGLIWTPHDPTAINIAQRLAPPSATAWLGRDPFGRDLASMLIAGATQSLAVSCLAVAIGAGLGVPTGVAAACAGGATEALLMRAADLMFAFPALLTAVMIATLAGPGGVGVAVAIGLFNVPVFARVARAAAAVVWRLDYVTAARVAGRNSLAIAWRHVLPNIAAPLVVQATLQFALAIVAESGLAYVGLGTQPPQPSWGRMLADAQSYVWRAPQLALLPGVAIALAVLGLNLLGDGLQDLMDPRRE